jgi:carbon storage regulator
MNIVNLNFEEPLLLLVNGQRVEVIVFKTAEHGNIKFGVNAPYNLGVDREEIYFKKKKTGG